MTGHWRTQEDVARAALVSVVTIRKWYKLLTEEPGLKIPFTRVSVGR